MGHPFVIIPGEDTWSLGCLAGGSIDISVIDHDEADGAESNPDRTCRAMDKLGYAGEPVLLALPSRWCASASIPAVDHPRKDRHASMAYQLEEKLPLAAEEFSAGFIPGRNAVLGICAILGEAAPLIEQLESRGVYVHSVVPAAILATQHVIRQASTPADIVLWGNDGWCDILIMDTDNQRPVAWSTIPNDPGDVALQLNVLAIQGRDRLNLLVAGDHRHEIENAISGSPVVDQIRTVDESMEDAVAAGSESILADRVQPWADLNGTALGASGKYQRFLKPLKAAMVAAVFMIICLNVAMLWRAHHYEQTAGHDADRQRVLFAELFPRQKVPQTIDKRLASELKKISGTRGVSQALPPTPMTMTLFHHVLNRLPSNVRFRLTEVRIEDDSLYLDGQARSHSDVGSIARSLGADDPTLTVETRHTEQLSSGSGVGFVIVAEPTSENHQVSMR